VWQTIFGVVGALVLIVFALVGLDIIWSWLNRRHDREP